MTSRGIVRGGADRRRIVRDDVGTGHADIFPEASDIGMGEVGRETWVGIHGEDVGVAVDGDATAMEWRTVVRDRGTRPFEDNLIGARVDVGGGIGM